MTESLSSEHPADPAEILAQAGWLRAMTRGLVADPSTADEIEQETWRAALARPPRSAEVRAWMRAVARKLFHRKVRDESARAHHEGRAAREARVELAEPSAIVQRLELQRRIVDAVEALREPYRTAVTLRYLDELEYPEVARRMGIGEAAARQRVSRGLRELRTRLDGAYGGRAAWGALALAYARDPGAAAPLAHPSSPVQAGTTSLFLGGASMSAGLKVGGVALAALVVGVSLRWVVSAGAETPAPVEEVRPGLGTPLVAVEEPDVTDVPDSSVRAPADAVPPDLAEEEAAASVARIDGVVLGPDGEPREGAEVRLARRSALDYEMIDLEWSGSEEVVARTTADEEGRFAFEVEPERRYVLTASAPDTCEAQVGAAFAGGEYELVLAPAASLSGVVSRPDGLPARGANVRVRSGAAHGVGERATRTAAAGVYRFDGLAPGPYVLEVDSSEGATPPWESLQLEVGEERRLDVSLASGFLLTGRVTDASTGAPIAGAEISESWVFEKIVLTDAAGEFRYADYPREGYDDLVVRAKGFGKLSVKIRGYFDKEPRATHWEIELQPAVRVSGRVLAQDGTPLADAYVCCCASVRRDALQQTDFRGVRTDGEGRYLITDVRADLPHALFVQKDGFATSVWEIGPTTEDRELEDVVLGPGAVLTGRVTLADGGPFAHGRVVLRGSNPDRGERFGFELQEGLDSYAAERELTTDDDGMFRFVDLAAGEYTVSAEVRGQPHGGTQKTVEVEAGAAVDAGELVVDRGLVIEGAVLGPDGRGVGGVFVNASHVGDEIPGPGMMTGPDGSFRLSGLEPGVYDLGAYPFGGATGVQLARAKLDGVLSGSKGVEIRLVDAAMLSGRVVDASGEAVDHATVQMLVPDGPESWTQTGADGTFELSPPDGAVVTLVAHPQKDGADADKPFQFDADPAREGRVEGVVAGGPEVTIRLP